MILFFIFLKMINIDFKIYGQFNITIEPKFVTIHPI